MIIKEDNEPHELEQIVETPPPYTPESDPDPYKPPSRTHSSHSDVSAFGAAGSSSAVAEASTAPHIISVVVPPSLQRTSCVHIRKENWALKGSYLIDPYLPFPEDIRQAAYSKAEQPKNLHLDVTNGNINADVWLVGGETFFVNRPDSEGGPRKKRTFLELKGAQGFITAKINANCETHPFVLTVNARNGGVNILLPESFNGPLTTFTRNGWVSMSKKISANVTTFSDIRGTKKCFIGDFPSSNYGQGEWLESSLDIACENGRIRLAYIGEEDKKSSGKGSSFLGMLFGGKS